MSISKISGKTVDVHIWSPVHEVESQALTQLRNIASLPWVFSHVSAMADCHLGKGATVGSVIAMKNAVSPSAVGVDIGCGVSAVKTSLYAKDLPDDLRSLRLDIEASVPVGFSAHDSVSSGVKDLPLWGRYSTLDSSVKKLLGKAMNQCGTLGGGNHMLSIALDSIDQVWVLLHSGSRNIGKSLAEIHIEKAKKLIHNKDLPDPDLAVFLAKTPEMQSYRNDLYFAQDYAAANRSTIISLTKEVLTKRFPDIKYDEPVACHHNYVAEEVHFGEEVFITRKGAISAKLGEMGIILGSMGKTSYVVKGLGNPESFTSASHGAGRRMSRGEAKRHFTLEDLAEQTSGVECRKDGGVLDEIPGAYKDIETVMNNQSDLVEIVEGLREILVIKG